MEKVRLFNYQHLIDGKSIESKSGARFERVSPAHDKTVGTYSDGAVEDVDLAIQSARRAFDSGAWPKLSGAQRARHLRKVAELIGRLSGLQGDSSTGSIQRRMSETYGERETTRRSTSRVIQTMANWGWVDRVENGKRVNRITPTVITNDVLTAWLIEASVIYAGRPVAVTSLHSLPVLFPFTLALPLAYLVSSSPNLNLRSEGPSNQFVELNSKS